MKLSSEVIKAAQAAYDKWSVPASIALAQYGLESSWGTRMPHGSNNPFGIKAASGQPSVAAATHEEVHGRFVSTVARFRKFASIAEAFDAHGQLLATHAAYKKAMAAPTVEDFANALTGVYATDRQYGAKLIGLMDADNLYQYDGDDNG